MYKKDEKILKEDKRLVAKTRLGKEIVKLLPQYDKLMKRLRDS